MKILEKYEPLLFLSENQLLLYKLNGIYLYDFNTENIEYVISFDFSFKRFFLGRLSLFSRLFRLNIYNAVSLDDTHVLLVFNKLMWIGAKFL